MLNEEKYEDCNKSSQDLKFKSILKLTPTQLEKQENLDFVCRFLAHYKSDISSKYDVDEFVTNQVKELLISTEDIKTLLKICVDTAEFLHDTVGTDTLRRYENGTFSGRVGKVAFECIFMGTAKNLDAIRALSDPKSFMTEKIKSFWNGPLVNEVLGTSMNGSLRISKTIPYGRAHFNPAE